MPFQASFDTSKSAIVLYEREKAPKDMTVDTKTALLNVAEDLARMRGFDGFSYADLAEAVGIRKASIHYHFPTKAGLSLALIDRYAKTMFKACEDIKESYAKGSDQLLALTDIYRTALNGGKSLCLCVSLTTSHQSLSDEVNTRIKEFRVVLTDWIETVFSLGCQDGSIAGVTAPHMDACACLAMLEGAHLAARAEENVDVFDRAVAVLQARCT